MIRIHVNQITTSSNQVAEMVQHIAASTEEQTVASREVSDNLEQVNRLGHHSSKLAQEAQSVALELEDRAIKLNQLIKRFQLE